MAGLLKGIRIIDLTRLQSGPYCTMALGDLGAEVIKIENPRGGDLIRWYPPLGKSESGYFLALNRNKKSIKLDIWTDSGREVFKRLVDSADIVIEQYRPGVLKKIGLDYQQLQERNPRIIMASISAYGQTGPYSSLPAHDINLQAISGILKGVGRKNSEPVISGVPIADMAASLWTAFALLAALWEREHSGQGQYIDVSIQEAALSFQTLAAGELFTNNYFAERCNEPLIGVSAWYNVYPTADQGYLAIGLLEFKFWSSFCKAIECEEFVENQFGPPEVQEKMIQKIESLTIQKSLQEWMDILQPLNICVTPVNNLEEALKNQQIEFRQMVQEVNHPVEGVIKLLGIPVKFSRTPVKIQMPPPLFGQHTEEILMELGYNISSLERFKCMGVI
ncbi:MAG: CaiB/BaiF CoA transferase family protein [Syntrophomonadaceae bacterium]|jgi:crotonobetainyl-CoA:carnitine CoA-transferase CaiB-like acyl-CoA transferase